MAELKNPIMFLKTIIFKSHNIHKNLTGREGLFCNNSVIQLRPLLIRLSHKTSQKQQIQTERKTSNNFTTPVLKALEL